jgi:hypothetical protein
MAEESVEPVPVEADMVCIPLVELGSVTPEVILVAVEGSAIPPLTFGSLVTPPLIPVFADMPLPGVYGMVREPDFAAAMPVVPGLTTPEFGVTDGKAVTPVFFLRIESESMEAILMAIFEYLL